MQVEVSMGEWAEVLAFREAEARRAMRRAVKAAMCDMQHGCHGWELEEKRGWIEEFVEGLWRYGYVIKPKQEKGE
jgi:hypothetical protein